MRLVKLGNNFHKTETPALEIFYSYATPIAFRVRGDDAIVRENDWGPTTGKHMNQITHDKTDRIPGDEFEAALDEVFRSPALLTA